VRVFKNSWFQRFARKERIADASLCEAVARAKAGLIDADLGGGLIKQRVARAGGGKSGGYRTLVFFRAEARAIFAFGFAKSDRDNIDAADQAGLKKAARTLLALPEAEIDALVAAGTFEEVDCGGQGKADKNLPE
jgi:hypothetical protein